MAKKKIKRRKRVNAEQLRKAHSKEVYWTNLKKRHITPEYCRAMITELTRLIAEKT